MGRLPRHHRRQERRRERRRSPPPSRTRTSRLETGALRDTARAAPAAASPPSSTGRAASAKRLAPGLVILSAGAVNSAVSAPPLGPRQPLRPGRAQLHEPQLLGGAGGEPLPPQHRRLPEDPRHQRLLPDRRQGRHAARQRPASRQGLGADPRRRRRRPGAGRGLARRPRRRSLCDERGPARPQSRVTLQGDRIVLDWRRSNWEAHEALVARLKAVLRRAGFPVVLSRPFDRRTPSHQCGTARMGTDPATSVVDTFCRATTTRTCSWSTRASCRPPRR